jgi:hypothetical protein
MSVYGIRGPFTDFLFTGIRLANDQTLENWTGAGAPPWTWPVWEQVIDILHKGVFAFATGFVSGQAIGSRCDNDADMSRSVIGGCSNHVCI